VRCAAQVGRWGVTRHTPPGASACATDVVLEDAEGNVFSIHGAEWIGGTENVQTGTFQFTDTNFFTIVSSGGGVVGTVRAVFHISPNGKIVEVDFGTCELPGEE
jgi:hypothetical protein